MIFNDEFLFIHVPKTAGMSITDALLKCLKRPVYYAVQEGHARKKFRETVLTGKRHQTLAAADSYFEEVGLPHRLETFKYIMVMVRNPYEMEVSRYHYLRKGNEWDRGKAHKLAMTGDFPAFVAGSSWWFNFEDYYLVDGHMPDNLYVIRFENFEQTMQLSFGQCFKKKFRTALLNKSHSTNYRNYYNPELELLVYKKYQWIFDRGYYSRENF